MKKKQKKFQTLFGSHYHLFVNLPSSYWYCCSLKLHWSRIIVLMAWRKTAVFAKPLVFWYQWLDFFHEVFLHDITMMALSKTMVSPVLTVMEIPQSFLSHSWMIKRSTNRNLKSFSSFSVMWHVCMLVSDVLPCHFLQHSSSHQEIDGQAWDSGISIADELKIPQSCPKPSEKFIWSCCIFL